MVCCSMRVRAQLQRTVVDEQSLSRTFSLDEVSSALFAMDINSSPGPDGFGLAFYRTYWQQTKFDLLSFLNSFHDGSVDLNGINRAHLVLHPKKDGANSPDAFRPISLQNCPMKLITKILTIRLRPFIPNLIDPDQTGFVHGRNIDAVKFVYAADFLSCCHKRQAPTAVLKRSWDSLHRIMRARGFGTTWCSWVSRTLHTGKTAILLNGTPGRWFQCHRGLRQADPISPYLFIIVAGVLQRLIQQASANGELCHPINPTIPYPVL